MPLDSSKPLYYQVIASIKESISNHIYKPGDKLPAEKSLSETFGVSRVTVRNALDQLVTQGVLEHRLNKGYYVSRIKSLGSARKAMGLYNALKMAGYEPSSVVISMETKRASAHARKEFNCMEDDLIIVIHRVRCASDKPFVDEYLYLPEKRFRGLNPWDLTSKSLHDVLRDEYDVEMSYSDRELKARIPTKEQKKLLQLKSNKPQLYIRSRVYDANNKIIYYSKILYVTDIMEYVFVWENPTL